MEFFKEQTKSIFSDRGKQVFVGYSCYSSQTLVSSFLLIITFCTVFTDMALTKTCPKCGALQHCRRAVCNQCNYIFISKASKKSIVKQSRAKESDIGRMVRRESDRLHKATSRACESEQERENRVSSDKVTRARKRARETEEQSSMHKASDRQSKARVR